MDGDGLRNVMWDRAGVKRGIRLLWDIGSSDRGDGVKDKVGTVL